MANLRGRVCSHFTFLADKGVLPSGLAGQLAAAVKVRNLVGHGYVAVDPQKMYEAAVEIVALVDPAETEADCEWATSRLCFNPGNAL